jgi:hypothetical protein
VLIHRYEVPADGQWHDFYMNGMVLFVSARRDGFADCWAFYSPETDGFLRQFAVVATGAVMPDGSWLHVGSAVAPAGYVYHVVARRSRERESSFLHPEQIKERGLNVGVAGDFA